MSKPLYLLDSGAFSAKYSGADITLDEYISFCQEHSDIFRGGCINLDVIGHRGGSYKNWKTIRAEGVDAIPVLHLQADDTEKTWEYWLDRYIEEADHIAIGAIAKLNTSARTSGLERIWDRIPKDDEGNPLRKVHGLGLTSLRLIIRFPWHSIDSASCIKNAANGAIYIPGADGGTLCDYDVRHVRSVAVSDQRKHETGRITSFYDPAKPTLRKMIIAYANARGYEISESISGRVLKPRRAFKGEDRTVKYTLDMLENEIYEGKDEGVDNLTTSYVHRECLNFQFFYEMLKFYRDQGKHVNLYQVCSTNTHVREVIAEAKKAKAKARILLSYFVLKSKPSLRKMILSGEEQSK